MNDDRLNLEKCDAITIPLEAMKDVNDDFHRGQSRGHKCCSCRLSISGLSSLSEGSVKSCACLSLDNHHGRIHGESKAKTPEYRAYVNLLQRCFNSNNPTYHHYGGRGITVCQRWRDAFDNFMADMGARPQADGTSMRSPWSIERRNNDGPYEPDNCKWEHITSQIQNRRCTKWHEYEGKLICRSEFARTVATDEVPEDAVLRRLGKGWTIDKILSTPVKKYRKSKPEAN